MTARRPSALAIAIAALAVSGGALEARAQEPAAGATVADAARALSAGDLDRATSLAQAVLKGRPADADARVLLARVHLERGDADAAYVQLDRALGDRPDHVDALYYMGLVSAALAQGQFERLVRLAPDSARAHQLLAEGAEAQEKHREAEREYEAALARKPDLLEALLALGKLKRIRLACDEAVALYERADAVRPTFDAAYGLGVCRGYLQDDEGARRAFEQATARDRRSAVAWVGLGTTLTKLGRPTDAIQALRRAIEIEPRMGEAFYALGLAYQAAKQPDLARDAFRKAQEFGGAR